MLVLAIVGLVTAFVVGLKLGELQGWPFGERESYNRCREIVNAYLDGTLSPKEWKRFTRRIKKGDRRAELLRCRCLAIDLLWLSDGLDVQEGRRRLQQLVDDSRWIDEAPMHPWAERPTSD